MTAPRHETPEHWLVRRLAEASRIAQLPPDEFPAARAAYEAETEREAAAAAADDGPVAA